MRIGAAAVGVALIGCGCSRGPSQTACATGSHLENGQCVQDLGCGAGTHLLGNQCVVDTDGGPALTCGPGTLQLGSTCWPNGGNGTFCGPGTFLLNNECLPTTEDGGAAVMCGPGTEQVGMECLPAGDGGIGVSCGPGTVLVGNQCLPDFSVWPDGGPNDGGRSEAPSFLVDAAHTNAQVNDTVASPLTPAWTMRFNGPVSYPLVVGGHAIVSVAESQPNVRALDVDTGALVWGPIVFGAKVSLAYDQGTVFALDPNGVVTGLNAATGQRLWAIKLLTQPNYTSPPVATAGIVVVNGTGDGGNTSALNALNGALRWTDGTFAGSQGTVAIAGGVIYEEEACDQISAFNILSGARLWFHMGSCSSADGGEVPSIYGGYLWVRDVVGGNLLLDLSGNVVGSFAAGIPPAFHGGVAFYVNGGIVSAVDLTTSILKWSFTGDGTLCTPPVVAGAGGQVLIGSAQGNVYELDEATGTQRSVHDAGVPVTCFSETDAISLGANHLLVPAGNTLIVY